MWHGLWPDRSIDDVPIGSVTNGVHGTARDLTHVGRADFGLYQHEKHMLGQEYQNWVAFGTLRPAHLGGLDGVPVIVVYEDPRVVKAPAR